MNECGGLLVCRVPRDCQVSPSVLSCQFLFFLALLVGPLGLMSGSQGCCSWHFWPGSAPVTMAFWQLPILCDVCGVNLRTASVPHVRRLGGAWLWLPVASSAQWEVAHWVREGAPDWGRGQGVQGGLCRARQGLGRVRGDGLWCVGVSWEGLTWGCEVGARLGRQQFLLLRLLSRDPASPVGSWETHGWLGGCSGASGHSSEGADGSVPALWSGMGGQALGGPLISSLRRLPCTREPVASGDAVCSARFRPSAS